MLDKFDVNGTNTSLGGEVFHVGEALKDFLCDIILEFFFRGDAVIIVGSVVNRDPVEPYSKNFIYFLMFCFVPFAGKLICLLLTTVAMTCHMPSACFSHQPSALQGCCYRATC